MIYGYGRVSRDAQSSASQITELLNHGIPKVAIFIDQITGASTARPQLDKLIDLCEAGDLICFTRLDRLARSLPDLFKIIENLEGKGIKLKSLSEPIDTSGPQGRLLLAIFGAVAEFERALITERVKSGIIAAKARGRCGGRPRAITGEKLEEIIYAARMGKNASQIARIYSLDRSTVARELKLHDIDAPCALSKTIDIEEKI